MPAPKPPSDETFDESNLPVQKKSLETLVDDGYSTLPSGIADSPVKAAPTSPTIGPDPIDPPPTEARPAGSNTAAMKTAEFTQFNERTNVDDSQQRKESSPTEILQGVLPDDTVLPSNIAADYATVAPSQVAIVEFDDSTQRRVYPGLNQAGASFGSPLSDLEPAPTVRYHILREHAKGGLGKVFVAEDLELQREVAFKEIQKKYADDRETQIRFLREAKITGGLEHPGIVPVYGLGTYADGRPYYAMRFIRGHSLQQAINAFYRSETKTTSIPSTVNAAKRQVEFRQLLRRFIDVCNALEYAHAQGIIHRDLKPGNIMLGEYGETLVVDWGLAKSYVETEPIPESDASLTPRSRLSIISGDGSLQTLAGTVAGTPQFMSPEQAKGHDSEVGPASDIYSLGATLYCILTGSGAFTGKTVEKLIEQVVAGEFSAPQRIQPNVPNPLNAICLKAMARLPAQRYATSRALAEDIERWLADEPVVAYQETRRERFSRWIRKHQARAQAIAVSVIGIAVVSMIAAVLIDQSRRAEAKAKHNLEIANAAEIRAKKEVLRRSGQTRDVVDTVLSGMSKALKLFPDTQASRIRLLEYAAAEYAKLAEDNSADPELKAEAARNLVRLGDVRQLLKTDDQVMEEYTRAANEFSQLIQAHPDVPDYPFELAKTYIQIGIARAHQGQHNTARQQFQDALELLKPLTEKYSDNLEYLDGLGTALFNAGRAQEELGEISDAELLLQQGLAQFDQLHRKEPQNLGFASAKAKAFSALGRFFLDHGRPLEADKLFSKSLAIREDVFSVTKDPESFADQASIRIDVGNAFRDVGRWTEATRNYQSAADDFQELVQADPNVTQYLENLVVARTNLGPALRRLGKNVEAIKVLELSLQDLQGLENFFEPAYFFKTSGTARVALALTLSELDQQDKASEIIQLALDDCQKRIDLDPKSAQFKIDQQIAIANFGRILARKGDFLGGREKYHQAIDALDKIAKDHPDVPAYQNQLASTWTQLGNLAFHAKQMDQAKLAFVTAKEIREKLQKAASDNPQFQDSQAWLLATCPIDELRDPSLALKLAQEATKVVPESPQFHLTLGAAQLRNQQPDAALKSLQSAFQDDATKLYLVALCEIELQQPENARKTLAMAQAWRKERKPADEELLRWEQEVEQRLGRGIAK